MQKLNNMIKTIAHQLDPFKGFILKLSLVVIALQLFLPDFSQLSNGLYEQLFAMRARISLITRDERTQIYALGLIQNPAALYQISLLDESKKQYGGAIRHMQFAIGLLEMHGAEKAVLKKYQDRLEALKVLEKTEVR
jgi:hypothetical protein